MTKPPPAVAAPAPKVSDEAGRWASLPGIRVFRSARFRVLVAGLVVLAGVVLNLMRLLAFDLGDPAVGLDFAAYYRAAEQVASGASPYARAQVGGSVAAYCRDCYLYPPVLAQVLQPVTLVSLETAKLVWFAVGYAAAFASTWLATGIGGAPRSLERLLWVLAAVLMFDAVGSAVWGGNIGNLVALCVTLVAMGGLVAGVGGALGALLKVAPATLLPAVFVAERRSRVALLVIMAIVAGVSFLLAPQAWLDYPSVLAGVFSDPSEGAANLSLSQGLSSAGWESDALLAVRLSMLALGVVLVIASVWSARREGGMPMAALLGSVAMLIIPGTLWFHYLAVLLPLAAMAWPRARLAVRSTMLAGAVLVSTNPLLEDWRLVWLGATLMLVSSGLVLWPRRPRPGEDPGHALAVRT